MKFTKIRFQRNLGSDFTQGSKIGARVIRLYYNRFITWEQKKNDWKHYFALKNGLVDPLRLITPNTRGSHFFLYFLPTHTHKHTHTNACTHKHVSNLGSLWKVLKNIIRKEYWEVLLKKLLVFFTSFTPKFLSNLRSF